MCTFFTNTNGINGIDIRQVHFETDMFEKRIDGKKRLRCNAIPTIFKNDYMNDIIASGNNINIPVSGDDVCDDITASDNNEAECNGQHPVSTDVRMIGS